MGWFALALIAAIALAALWLLKLPRAIVGFAGAAVMLAATGYALQGSPSLASATPVPVTPEPGADADLIELRTQMFGRFQYADSYFFVADALTRSGNERAAARAMLGGVRTAPNSVPLWTWLAFATAQADGAMSPAAKVAFRRAHMLNPEHPGPWFFEGLAYIRLGDLNAARTAWARALAVSHADAPYREPIAQRLALLDRVIEAQAAEGAAQKR